MPLQISKRTFSIPLILFTTLLIAIAIAVALYHYYMLAAGTKAQFTMSWHVYFNLFYWLCWLLFIPLIQLANIHIKISSNILYSLTFYFLLPLIIISIHQVISSIVIHFVLNYKDIPALIQDRIIESPWIWVDFVLYFIVLIGLGVIEYREKINSRLTQSEKLNSQLFQTQLEALKSQVHPHFLFNTLNTLSTLILKNDNHEAKRMISLLKNFLNTTINENNKNEVTLKEEIVFINHYLEIEKVRFKDKLTINLQIEKETEEALVPNFLLQPIVENAIRYAIAPQKSNGVIHIRAQKKGNTLVLKIEDNGPGLSHTSEEKRKGIGLKITRERLIHMYGQDYQFVIDNSDLGGLLVKISISYKLKKTI